MNKVFVVSFIRFFRWPNLVMIVLLFFLFDHFILGPLRDLAEVDSALERWQFVMLIMDVLIVTIVGYWLNDFYDLKVDTVNRPNRFLVRYAITERRFFSWVFSLMLVGLTITIVLALKEQKLVWTALYPLTIVALWMYAKEGKKWGVYGNVLVSFCIACIPFLLIVAEGELISSLENKFADVYRKLTLLLLCFAALMFLFNLVREIVKDLQDMAGDVLVESKSIPITLGVKGSKISVVLILALSTSVQWCLFYFLGNSFSIFSYSIVITLLVALSVLIILKSTTSMGYAKASLMLKILMIVGLFELIFTPIV